MLYFSSPAAVLFADTYKGFEWGTDIDVVLEDNELFPKTSDQNSSEDDNKEKHTVMLISYPFMDRDMLAHFYEIPIVCDSNSPDQPNVNNKMVNRVLKQVYRSTFCEYQDSACPDVTVIPVKSDNDDQSSNIEFYNGKYFCFTNQIAIHSFDQVLKKLIRKYGKTSKYAGDSLGHSNGTFTCYKWVSGDTVILLNKCNEFDGSSGGRTDCSLTYMSKSITDMIRKEIKKNIYMQKKNEEAEKDKITKKDLDSVE